MAHAKWWTPADKLLSWLLAARALEHCAMDSGLIVNYWGRLSSVLHGKAFQVLQLCRHRSCDLLMLFGYHVFGGCIVDKAI